MLLLLYITQSCLLFFSQYRLTLYLLLRSSNLVYCNRARHLNARNLESPEGSHPLFLGHEFITGTYSCLSSDGDHGLGPLQYPPVLLKNKHTDTLRWAVATITCPLALYINRPKSIGSLQTSSSAWPPSAIEFLLDVSNMSTKIQT